MTKKGGRKKTKAANDVAAPDGQALVSEGTDASPGMADEDSIPLDALSDDFEDPEAILARERALDEAEIAEAQARFGREAAEKAEAEAALVRAEEAARVAAKKAEAPAEEPEGEEAPPASEERGPRVTATEGSVADEREATNAAGWHESHDDAPVGDEGPPRDDEPASDEASESDDDGVPASGDVAPRESETENDEGEIDFSGEAVPVEGDLPEGELSIGGTEPIDGGEPIAPPGEDVGRKHLAGLLEALLFVSTGAMSLGDLAKQAHADKKLVREVLGDLQDFYKHRGVRLEEVASRWLFRTSAAYAPFVRDATGVKPVKLTRAQVETLSIVAYRQPITRPEIDDVRGVDSGPVLKILLERALVRILGKREEAGRPLIYGTTPYFLEFFGLKSLKDMPTLREFSELTDESRRTYERELGEDAPESVLDMGGLAGGEGHVGDGAAAASAEDATTPAPAVDPVSFEDPEPDAVAADGETSASEPAGDGEAPDAPSGAQPDLVEEEGVPRDEESPVEEAPAADETDDKPPAEPREESEESKTPSGEEEAEDDDEDDEDDEDDDDDDDDEDEDEDEDDEDEDDDDEDEDEDEEEEEKDKEPDAT